MLGRLRCWTKSPKHHASWFITSAQCYRSNGHKIKGGEQRTDVVENLRKPGDVRHLCCGTHPTFVGSDGNPMMVNVASAVNEVTTAYNVDEHQLELTLKIPSDRPLQRVAMKDSKKTENR